ncbi:MAG: MFS transporter [Acidimicrobiia bacterium]
MVFGTVAGPAVGILASTLIERFDLTRADIGRLAALYALVGAAVSPLTGRLADRLGGRRMMAATFLGGAVTFAAYATAGGAAMLLVAAALSGIPNGTGNQATNRLIATTLPVTQRGLVTGVKQSGVQLGRFLAGMILPTTVAAWGLGASYTALAVLALAGAAVTLRLLPADAPAASPGAGAAAPAQRLPAAVWWLAGYAFLLGAVAGATSAFTALFAEQEVGFTRGQAGFMVGLTGGAAVVSRIALSRVAQRVAHYGPALAWIAFGSALSIALTAASPGLGRWALWAGTVGVAVTVGSWNSVAMLGAMASVPLAQAGRSSGRVMVGFLGGLGLAPPLFGAAVDRSGSYPWAWTVLAGLCTIAATAMVAWRLLDRRSAPAVG